MPEHGGTLAGKVALVTGGSRRIGKEIALRLARAGAAVALNARTSRREVDAVVAEIAAAGGTAVPALADITDPQANAAMIDATVRSLGRLDIVVHSAVVRQRVHRRCEPGRSNGESGARRSRPLARGCAWPGRHHGQSGVAGANRVTR